LRGNPKQIWKRYAAALLVLLCAITAAHVIALSSTHVESELARAINIAGRQRTLSQQILYYSERTQSDPDDVQARQSLIQTMADFEQAHTALTQGGDLGLTGHLSAELEGIYFQDSIDRAGLDAQVKTFLGFASLVLNGSPDQAAYALSQMEISGPKALLVRLNDAVTAFERSAQAAATNTRKVANLSYAVAMLVILLEVIFIFFPAHRIIVSAIDDLNTAMKQLRTSERNAQRAAQQARAARIAADAGNEAKSTFLSNMSHEIRTPMNAVLLALDLAVATKDQEEQAELLATATRSARSLLSLINDLLDVSKIDAGKIDINPEATDIRGLMESVTGVMAPLAAEKDLQLFFRVEDCVPHWLMLDGDRVRQIVTNYAGNAIKFTETGHVTLSIRSVSNGFRPFLEIAVTDTGTGINADDMDRLFTRFTQLSNATTAIKGTGLGLAICRQLAELMGGEVGAESTAGKGSRFWLKLPMEAAQQPDRQDHLNPSTEDRARYKILVAEDIKINQILIQKLLMRMGHVVHVVGDGQDVLHMLRNTEDAPFDLILMDNQMPTLGGIETTERLRETPGPNQTIPIIALTADAMVEQRESFRAVGMNGFVAKPIESKKLAREIDRVMRAAKTAESLSA